VAVIYIRDRVTADEQEFDANASSDRSLLLLENANHTESFSVELTVGLGWSENYSALNNHMHAIEEQQRVDLLRNSSIVVEVAEEIRVPHNMYGIVVPTGSLFLDKGVIIAAAKVEPSFIGKLKLRLVNTTPRTVSLAHRDKLASIIFFSTEVTKHQPTVEKRANRDKKPPTFVEQSIKWLRTHYIQLITWLITAAVGAVAAELIQRNYPNPNESGKSDNAEAARVEARNPQKENKLADSVKEPDGNRQ
jgi:deoxycytidine triphosphate deaminase